MLMEKARLDAYVREPRYPLPLAPAMSGVWELWRRAKTLEWDPQTDIPWETLHPERYSAEQLLAADPSLRVREHELMRLTCVLARRPECARVEEEALRRLGVRVDP